MGQFLAAWIFAGAAAFAQASSPGSLEPTPRIPPRVNRALADDYQVQESGRLRGLRGQRFTSLARTRDGYLWIGTSLGLVRFDGVRTLRFDRANTSLLADDRIGRIAEDETGNLWVATEDRRLAVLTREGWLRPRFEGDEYHIDTRLHAWGTGAARVWFHSGGRWFHSTNATSRRTGSATVRLASPEDLPNGVRALFEWPNEGRCWFLADALEVVRSGAIDTQRYALDAFPDPNLTVIALAAAPDGSLWFIRGNVAVPNSFQAYRFASGGLERLDDALPDQMFEAQLTADADGGVWHAAGEGAVGRLSTEARVRYQLPPEHDSDRLVESAVTEDGTVWLALERGGVLPLRPRRTRSVTAEQGLTSSNVRCVVPGMAGTLLAGTEDGVAEVRVDANGPAGTIRHLGLRGLSVRTLALDRDGTLWAGTVRGLFRQVRGNWEEQPLPRLFRSDDGQGFGSIKVRGLLLTRRGDLWVATAHQLLVRSAGDDDFRRVAWAPESTCTDLLEDRAGNLWVGTGRHGVAGWSAERLAAMRLPVAEKDRWAGDDAWLFPPNGWLRSTNGLASDWVWELYEDQRGDLWAAGDRGLQRISAAMAAAVMVPPPGPLPLADPPFAYTVRHGLPDHAINSLLEDDRSDFWLGTDTGVLRVPAAEWQAVASGRSPRLRLEVFTRSSGLPAEETNGRISHPGACRGPDGRLWFATIAGLVGFLPTTTAGESNAPPVVIEEIRADGRVVRTTLPQIPEGGAAAPQPLKVQSPDPAENLVRRRIEGICRLGPGEGRILEIHFAGFDFDAPAEVRFEYQMAGYDDTLYEVGTRRVVYFTNLDPGEYRFRVWAINRQGGRSREPAELQVVLTPFLWQTGWFRVAATLVVVGAVAAVAAWRLGQIRRFEELRRRAEQAELRGRLARDLHDGVGSGLARLAVLSHLPPGETLSAPEAARKLNELSSAVRELAQTVREISWNASPSTISLESLLAQIAQQGAEFLGSAGVRCRTQLPLEIPGRELSPDQRSNLYYSAKEALTNVVRHAGATEARLEVVFRDGTMTLSLWDNGRGWLAAAASQPSPGDPSNRREPSLSGGHGLPNLRARIALLGGRVEVGEGPAIGTTIRFEIPLERLGTGIGDGNRPAAGGADPRSR